LHIVRVSEGAIGALGCGLRAGKGRVCRADLKQEHVDSGGLQRACVQRNMYEASKMR
jgi:hypothetical protein